MCLKLADFKIQLSSDFYHFIHLCSTTCSRIYEFPIWRKNFQIGIHKRTSDLVKFIVVSHRVLSSNSFEFLCNMQTFFDLCMSVYFRIFWYIYLWFTKSWSIILIYLMNIKMPGGAAACSILLYFSWFRAKTPTFKLFNEILVELCRSNDKNVLKNFMSSVNFDIYSAFFTSFWYVYS